MDCVSRAVWRCETGSVCTGPALTTAHQAIQALDELADPASVPALQRYFKTGPGEYGEGDVFIGVRTPQIRAVAREADTMSFEQLDRLFNSRVHEHRQLAVHILNRSFAAVSTTRTFSEGTRARCVDYYLRTLHRGRIDNWDLVDASAYRLLGEYLTDRDRSPLIDLAGSPMLWERRVAIVATFAFIKRGDGVTTLTVAEKLIDDPEVLIHKAVGWMLREVGKRVDKTQLTGHIDTDAARDARLRNRAPRCK